MNNKINKSPLIVIVAAFCLIISGCLGGGSMASDIDKKMKKLGKDTDKKMKKLGKDTDKKMKKLGKDTDKKMKASK